MQLKMLDRLFRKPFVPKAGGRIGKAEFVASGAHPLRQMGNLCCPASGPAPVIVHIYVAARNWFLVACCVCVVPHHVLA